MEYSADRSRLESSTVPLKPMPQAPTYGFYANTSYDEYRPVGHNTNQHWNLQAEEITHSERGRGIRIAKFIARAIGSIVSLVVVIPLVVTIIKYLETRDKVYDGNGTKITAWPAGTVTGYTWLYIVVSLLSFMLSTALLGFYCFHAASSSKSSGIPGIWSIVAMLGYIVAWAVSVGLFKSAAIRTNGAYKDLWGWSCSNDADAAQPFVKDVNYDRYCSLQTTSWYAGLVAIASAVLTAAIYLVAMLRSRSNKGAVGGRSRAYESDAEPLRQSAF